MKILSTSEAARSLQTSVDTVRRLIKAGELTAERLNKTGQFRIREDELRRYAADRNIPLPHNDSQQ